MTCDAVTSRDLSAWLLQRVPAIRPTYDDVMTWSEPDRDSYAMLGSVLVPYVEELLRAGDEAELQRVFDLLEYLANHGEGAGMDVAWPGSVYNELGCMMEP